MHSKRIANLSLLALALFLSFAVQSTAAAASHEVSVHVAPDLMNHGVRASVASVPPPAEQDAEAPIAVVFVTYEQPFHGDLYLKGFRKDGKEIARSETVPASEPAEAGGHIRFPFDKDTVLAQASSFILEGGPAPVPAKAKKESFGQATENIAKELLQ